MPQEAKPSPDSPKARQIIEGARKAFMQHGYEGASTEEIVRQAAISKGTLYSYFPSKKELFEVIIKEECQHQSQKILHNVDLSRPVRQVLRDLATGYLDLLLSPFPQDLFRLAVAEAKRFPRLAKAFYDSGPGQGIERLTSLMRTFADRGEIAADDPHMAACHFEQLCKADLFNKALFGVQSEFSKTEVRRVIDHAVDAFMKIYGATPAAR